MKNTEEHSGNGIINTIADTKMKNTGKYKKLCQKFIDGYVKDGVNK